MDKEKVKNIVVLKNLPSNIVDEAIVILKPNKKIKKIEVIDKSNNKKNHNNELNNNKHILNEAEMLINGYINEIENNNKSDKNFREKYKRLKKYSFISSLVLIMSILLHFI